MNRKLALVSLFVLSFLLITGINWQGWAAPLGQEGTPTEEAKPDRPIYGLDAEPAPFLEGGPEPELRPTDARSIDILWSKITFNSYRDDNYEIYIAESGGYNQTRLTWDAASDMTPRLNRGCDRIVFTSRRTGNYEIFSMNSDGSNLIRLTTDVGSDTFPVWSPDGTRIAFQSNRDGQYEIYVMNADGTGQTRLTWDSEYDGQPAWSPDGNKIAFVSKRTGGYRIYAMNTDSSNLVQLSNQSYSYHPIWSPDGSKIAYDSDGNGDGWQEIWLMNTDGSNQQQVFKSSGANEDAWAGSWTPNGQYIVFTEITWVYYQGNWYWQYAYINAWNTIQHTKSNVTSGYLDWYPDFQTTDALAPATSIASLPIISSAPFNVSWSGSDAISGIQNFDVQMREAGNSNWTDWMMATTATSGSFQGLGGHTYYFRVRGRDNIGNVEAWPIDFDAYTTVEALPPTTSVFPLLSYSQEKSLIHWGGLDPGGSGIANYLVQFRDRSDNTWIDWLIDVTKTVTEFAGIPGHVYDFRVKAVDHAQNSEAWPVEDFDATTVFYLWAIGGTLRDNGGVPVTEVTITTSPASFLNRLDVNGNFASYVAVNAPNYSTTWAKVGYGTLPETSFASGTDASVDIVMPPTNNILNDWGFENDPFDAGAAWLLNGDILPSITETHSHTGDFATLLGYNAPISLTEKAYSTNYYDWALDDMGVLHLAWTSSDMEIYYAQRSISNQWSTPENISNSPISSSSPRLAIQSNGIVHIVWQELDFTQFTSDVYYTSRNSNGTWSTLTNISVLAYDSTVPQIALDGVGNVHVFWTEAIYPSSSIGYTWRNASGVWSSPQFVAEDMFVYDFKFFVEDNGATHLVSQHEQGGIYYVYRTDDNNWTAPKQIYPEGRYPQISMDKTGNVHVTWNVWNAELNTYGVFYSVRNNKGEWSTPIRISRENHFTHYPRMEVDELGYAHIAWIDGFGGTDVYYVQCINDHQCTYPKNLSSGISGNSITQLKVDIQKSDLVVAWLDYDTRNVFYTRRTLRGTWSDTLKINSPSDVIDAENFRAQLDDNNNVHIVWNGHKLYFADPMSVPQSGDSTLSQSITIPPTMTAPTISFLYQLSGASAEAGSGFSVSISDSITTTTIFSTSANISDWTHAWFDLSPWLSQTITLTFNVHEVEDYPYAWAYLDEVTVGSAHPDVWVSAASDRAAALPGEQVTFALTYGNRGGADAISSTITATLPAGLIFESASISPTIVGDTLSWDVGSLPSNSGPFTILITATVASDATLGSTLAGLAEIAAATPEIETANNIFQFEIFIGQKVYLPMVMR